MCFWIRLYKRLSKKLANLYHWRFTLATSKQNNISLKWSQLQDWVCYIFGPFDWIVTSQSVLWLVQRKGMPQGVSHWAWLWMSVDFDDTVSCTYCDYSIYFSSFRINVTEFTANRHAIICQHCLSISYFMLIILAVKRCNVCYATYLWLLAILVGFTQFVFDNLELQ